MPPSPALRVSPGREMRPDNHRRGRSLEGAIIFREEDDDLMLFNEMQSREREEFLLQSTNDFEDTFSTKLKHFSDFKHGISIPVRGESSELLNADGEKNDYDWLLTPPDTPLFASLDDEPALTNISGRGRLRSQPISISRSSTMENRSSRGSASPQRLSPSPRSGNGTFQSRGRTSSEFHSSAPHNLRPASPVRRASPPPNKPATPTSRSLTPTPRRMSTGSSVTRVSSGLHGTSPTRTSRGNSASPKVRAWQSNISGFSLEPPPNLRTSLADRPASYVRGSSPASRNGSSRVGRQSMSPTASRSVSSSHSHDRDQISSHSRGSIASSGDDDVDTLQSVNVGSLDRLTSNRVGTSFSSTRAPAFSRKSSKSFSPSSAPKKSFDSSLRHLENRKSPHNMFRPLLSSVPSTTFYVGNASSAQRSALSMNSSVTTSSNASSDHGTSAALDSEETNHHRDNLACESGKLSSPDVQVDVFAFDKLKAFDNEEEHQTHSSSLHVQIDEFNRDLPIGDIDMLDVQLTSVSDALSLGDDYSEVCSLKSTERCSECGCRYRISRPEERDMNICPACSIKNTLTSIVGSGIGVADYYAGHTEKISEENRLLDVHLVIPKDTEVEHASSSQHEENAKQGRTSFLNQSQICLTEDTLAQSLVKGYEKTLDNQEGIGKQYFDHRLPDNGSEEQPQHNGDSNKIDVSKGAGISILLDRSSSSKAFIVQGRNFATSFIPRDDLSYSKETNSTRSLFGHGSTSLSSSLDFSSVRQVEMRVQRQISGKKFDTEHHRSASQSIGLPLSGVSDHPHDAPGFEMSMHEKNIETSIAEIKCGLRERPYFHDTDVSAGTDLVENSSEAGNSNRTSDASTSGLPCPSAGIPLEKNAAELIEICEEHEPNATIAGFPGHARSLSPAAAITITPESVNEAAHALPTCSFDAVDDSECAAQSTSDSVSGIQTEDCYQCASGSHSDDLSTDSISTRNEYQDTTVLDSDPAGSYQLHDITEESTVTVEFRGGRSLTLEEATDTILFCSSIVHDMANRAATIAMENEYSDLGHNLLPTVTILGRSNSGKKDPHGRNVVRRGAPKSQKARQKRLESDAKPFSTKTEKDENSDENVGISKKMESTMPPKLESKCNCTIM